MNHQEYVLSIIKKKYTITKPPVRATLNHYQTKTKHIGIYVEFKRGSSIFYNNHKLFINDTVGARCFHNSPGLLSDPNIPDCLWFKEECDEIQTFSNALKI